MSEHERVVAVICEWVEKAENDLKTAVCTLTLGAGCPADTVCFHAQQCVEKYLKALLVLKGTDFPKTHDLGELMSLLRKNIGTRLTINEQRRLTAYATVTRYPGNYEPIPLSEARRAVSVARRIRREVGKLLPKEALRKVA